MPKVPLAKNVEDQALFGKNARSERELKEWSIRDLAKAAGVSADTVCRIEAGGSTTKRIREKLCLALQADYHRLMSNSSEAGPGYAVHRRESDHWKVYYEDRLYRVPEDEEERVQNAEERERLGKLGFVQQFVRMLHCRLPRGRLVAGVLELYGSGTKDTYLSGEALIYVLSGKVRVVVGEESFLLSAGESATIECGREAFYFEPAAPVTSRPPTLLYVRLNEGPKGGAADG